jgi:hypothetical protein
MSDEPTEAAPRLAEHLSALVEQRLGQLRESLKASRGVG